MQLGRMLSCEYRPRLQAVWGPVVESFKPPNCIPQVLLAQVVVRRGEDVPAGARQLLLICR
jgi:hypothetical protein